jgi:hypothetical protein
MRMGTNLIRTMSRYCEGSIPLQTCFRSGKRDGGFTFFAIQQIRLHARDGDEAIPPFFLHLGTRIAFSHQSLLIKESRQAMCSLRCRGTNPGQ